MEALSTLEFDLKDTEIHMTGFANKQFIHSVELQVPVPEGGTANPNPLPLVFIPGYGTGAAIFALSWSTMLAGTDEDAQKLRDEIFAGRQLVAIDPLGCYNSSHPSWTCGQNAEKAERWFVESVEAWRAARGIERFDLFGHSIGGNVAACYAESFPSRVNTLILLSPAGVPREPADYRSRVPQAPFRIRMLLKLWAWGWSPHQGLQMLPTSRARRVSSWNARRWSRRMSDGKFKFDESALADYIHNGFTEGPSSGDRVLGAILHPGAWGKRPLCERLSRLRVDRLEFIYGETDWMDVRHGNGVVDNCGPESPQMWVQLVPAAGHYAHLENVSGFISALSRALGKRKPEDTTTRTATVPEGYQERWSGPNVPSWRGWEGYEFGR